MADPITRKLAAFLVDPGNAYGMLESGIGLGSAALKHLADDPLFGGGTGGLPDVTTKDGKIVVTSPAYQDNATVGNVVMMRPDAPEDAMKHEFRHADQNDVLGVYRPLISILEGFYPYGQGPLEKDAFAHMGGGAKDERGLIGTYLRNILGD